MLAYLSADNAQCVTVSSACASHATRRGKRAPRLSTPEYAPEPRYHLAGLGVPPSGGACVNPHMTRPRPPRHSDERCENPAQQDGAFTLRGEPTTHHAGTKMACLTTSPTSQMPIQGLGFQQGNNFLQYGFVQLSGLARERAQKKTPVARRVPGSECAGCGGLGAGVGHPASVVRSQERATSRGVPPSRKLFARVL